LTGTEGTDTGGGAGALTVTVGTFTGTVGTFTGTVGTFTGTVGAFTGSAGVFTVGVVSVSALPLFVATAPCS
jgi:hypothetical protein